MYLMHVCCMFFFFARRIVLSFDLEAGGVDAHLFHSCVLVCNGLSCASALFFSLSATVPDLDL